MGTLSGIRGPRKRPRLIMKRITAHLIITLILTISILGGFYGNTIYLFGKDRFVYGASDNWTDIDSSDLGSAFRAYCKSRNLAIEGSILDATTTWTTETVNSICQTLGIDITTLQAQCKKATDGNIGYKWLFSVTGMSLWNRIFAELLQNNNLSVGDNDVEKVVYSGEIFTDLDGNKCLVTYGAGSSISIQEYNYSSVILKMGTPYLYSKGFIYSIPPSNYTGVTVNLVSGKSGNFTFTTDRLSDSRLKLTSSFYGSTDYLYQKSSSYSRNGWITINKLTNNAY